MGGAQDKTGFKFPGYEGFRGEYDPRDVFKGASGVEGAGVAYRDPKNDSK